MRVVSHTISIILATLCFASWVAGQTPAAPANPSAPKRVKADEVVATIDGEKITAGQIDRLRTGAPMQFQAAARMNNRDFLKSVAGLLVLAKRAEQEKLDQQEPYKDQLEFLRLNFLANTYIGTLNTKIQVTPDELKKYYEEHQSEFEEAVVKAIYIAFSRSAGAEGPPRLTEEAARAKAERLVQSLRNGADFAKLARENSDDTQSAEKGGEISPLKRNSAGVPAEIRNVVFALKPGEISSPVPQPAGFYIFKLERIQTASFDEVAANIATTVQGTKVQGELQRLLTNIRITHENEAYFEDGEPAAETPALTGPGPALQP
jgi:parvulin-like peptidyl-prolyl isomerase